MNSRKIIKLILPLLSILFILETLRTGYGVDLIPWDVAAYKSSGEYLAEARSHIETGELSQATQYLQLSILATPLAHSSFLELSRIYIDTDETEKALSSLMMAFELAPYTYNNLWQIFVLSLRAGDEKLSATALSRIAIVAPYTAFEVAWKVYNNSDLILDNIITTRSLPSYLNYLLGKRKKQESLDAWDKIEKHGAEVDEALFSRYVNFLIENSMAENAYDLWTGRYGEQENGGLVWNGGFERVPLHSGFDWSVRKTDDAIIIYDSNEKYQGNYSLKVIFNGETNIDFSHVSKIEPVKPGTDYRFAAMIRTEGITTDSGVFWSVACYPSGNFNVRTPSKTGTNDWSTTEVVFTTPSENCDSVRITLRRLSIEKLDSYIRGSFWTDNIVMKEIDQS